MEVAVAEHREICLRCRRPRTVCWCSAVTQVPNQTRVVFIQHPREAKVPISTCRMAHLSLPNSELHVGITAVGNKSLEALCARPGVAVLFPSESAVDVDALTVPPETLVVVDGTWSNAKKVVEKCPLLSRLPRLKFFPDQPGNYRIRKEPEAHCLATIEATAFVLGRLEKAPARFTPILTAFDAMVEKQLDYIRENPVSTRHKNRKQRNTVKLDPTAVLRDRELVVVFGEANAWPLCDPHRPLPDAPELVQLVAERVSTGERFERLLKPVRPLGPRVPRHLDMIAEEIGWAESRESVIAEWKQFIRPGDLQLGWGSFCRDLLELEGAAPEEFVNLRSVIARVIDGSPGSVEELAQSLGVVLPEGKGRALRRLVSLAFVTRATLEGRVAPVRLKNDR
ncbi:MAG: tRNA-uridine aminocarboxypropyltransferase [Archangium sp.]|nr:tRNA-uridine aminocarboxypropyltransferase [Archangium sp.]MDP3573324.1 tRNA-uridine aminocarboxypropyltransferase [Archangium sp.]